MASRLPKPAATQRTIAMPKLRRSKSCTDVRMGKCGLPFKRPVLDPIPSNLSSSSSTVSRPQPSTTKTVLKSAMKRPAVKKIEEPKPKVARQGKVPDWDYKTRFQNLDVKHSQLRASFTEVKEKLAGLENIIEEYNTLKVNNESLTREHMELREKFDLLDKSNSTMKSNMVELEDKYAKTYDELHTLQAQYKILTTKISEQMKELDRLHMVEREHNILNEHHQQISKDHKTLQIESKECRLLKNNLEQKLASCLDDNKSLSDQVRTLQTELYKSETIRRVLHNTIQELKGNIRVFCRVRPPLETEYDRLSCNINLPDDNCIEIRKSKESINAISGKVSEIKCDFCFDRVFGQQSTQTEIFEELSQLVQSALDGYDVCVFAYGQTGSGKTYTMQGIDSPEDSGMIPRTVQLIFDKMAEYKRNLWDYRVNVSFVEIYNEMVRDLLVAEVNQNLDIKFNKGKGTTITNLSIVEVTSAQELINLMLKAHYNRKVAATNFNEYSSRSHAITKIHLEGSNELANVKCVGTINLVDLAGSENAKCTLGGERLNETKHINKSLSTLGTVMMSLWRKEKHIPYRNSKLTYLLQSSLGGTSKTLMIVNISPFEDNYSETVNSLRFASKVKEVKTLVSKNRTNINNPE